MHLRYPWKPGPDALNAVFTSISRLKRLKQYNFCSAEIPTFILMGMPYQHMATIPDDSLWYLDLDHSQFQAILTAQTVWCPSVMTRGVGDAERALDTLNYSSIRGRSRLRQKGWGLSWLNIYQLGEFGTILLWSFNVIEFLCLWVWACKSFQVPHYVEPTSLDEHPVFFFISGCAFALSQTLD